MKAGFQEEASVVSSHLTSSEDVQRVQSKQRVQRTQSNRETEPVVREVRWGSGEMEELVGCAVPNKVGCKHLTPFTLARLCLKKQKLDGGKISREQHRKLFRLWYDKARPFLRPGQSWDDYWFEYLEAVDRARVPYGEDLAREAYEIALKGPLPKVAGRFESQKVRILVGVCREMQRIMGDRPFHISYRQVQGLFGYRSLTTAGIWLKGLVHEGILKVVKAGGPQTMRSTRYLYLPPLDEDLDSEGRGK